MNSTFDLDRQTLSASARIDALTDAEREIARIQARQLRIIAAIADDPCTDAIAPNLEKEYYKEELRAALGESAISVNNRILLARELTGRLGCTLAALEAGTITLTHARQLSDAVIGLTDPDAADVQAAVLPFAPGRDMTAFVRKVRREVLKCDSRSAEEQLAQAVSDRRVWSRPAEPGMSLFGALLPADGAQLLVTALDVVADHARPDDPRTRDQRRADGLVQLAVDALNGYTSCPNCVVRNDNGEPASGSAARGPDGRSGRVDPDDNGERSARPRWQDAWPRWQGARPTIQVTVALSTLLGLDRQPGELAGYGPIPAVLALRLAGEDGATWRRLVTDELGRLIDYGRSTYRPPADLRDHVIARDQTCMFPTCHRRACRCDIDHATPWADGGRTDEANLLVLCCRHHHGKHEADWHLERREDGAVVWTSPTGHVYVVPARTYPVDTTLARAAEPDHVQDT